MNRTNDITNYLDNVALFLLGVLLIAFPLVFTTLTPDPFGISKQVLLGTAVIIGVLLFGAKMIGLGSIRWRKTPFDLPLFAFAAVALVSSLLSINQADALIAFFPLLYGILLYFLLTNFAKNEASVSFLIYCLAAGACAVSSLAILSYFKIYILPFPFSQIKTFSPLGNLLDQALYLGVTLPLCLYFTATLLKAKKAASVHIVSVLFVAISIVITAGLVLTVYNLVTLKPEAGGLLLLPFEAGFQTAFSAISRDTGRVLQSLLVGSGYGTYAVDFTRFKEPTINLNPTLWSFTFLRSSSLFLELLATTGILGAAAFIFLLVRIIQAGLFANMKKNAIGFSLFLAFLVAFLLPFGFIMQTTLLILLGLFALVQRLWDHSRFYEVEIKLIASKRGMLSLSAPAVPVSYQPEGSSHSFTKFLPVSLFFVLCIFALGNGILLYNFTAAHVLFQRSLVAAAQNNALETYNNQRSAIQTFDKKDVFYRVFSDINLRLANSIASSQPQGSSPSAQIQQTIFGLIQQSITSARTAADVARLTSANWENLASVYRNLIGFGQNAENFAILATQQAIALDPNNPQLYINLGGIYYQLGQWENAQGAFLKAVSLKPDYANAYYNLGHALEQKGDLQNALAQYQTVQSLVATDPTNSKKVADEIDALQKRIGSAQAEQKQGASRSTSAVEAKTPLEINTPSSQLPGQKTKVAIPTVAIPTPAPSQAPSPTSSPRPTLAQ